MGTLQINVLGTSFTINMLCDELYKEKMRLLKIKKQIDTEALTEVENITMNIINKIDQIL